VPTAEVYPDTVVRRVSFTAGGGLGWKISALTTPRATPAPWKIVVITGAPSWAEYWAPTLAALPQDREMIVVDRPGFAASEPPTPVTDIRLQATALLPLLDAAPGQKILLVGQSYGAAIATLMAQMHPQNVGGLVMLSSFLGELGPTSLWLVETGQKMLSLIPKDLRHAVIEVSGQAEQLHYMQTALEHLNVPVHVVHGDKDDFAPMQRAQRLALKARTKKPIRFAVVEGADLFINDGPEEAVIAALEGCIPPVAPAKKARRRSAFAGLKLPKLHWPHAVTPVFES